MVYANLHKVGVEAQLGAAFKNGGRLQFKARYADFSFDNVNEDTPLIQQAVFNIPQLSLHLNGTLKVGQKIYLQWYVKHLGKEQMLFETISLGQDLSNAPVLMEDLDPFTQIDANFQYQLNEQLGSIY